MLLRREQLTRVIALTIAASLVMSCSSGPDFMAATERMCSDLAQAASWNNTPTDPTRANREEEFHLVTETYDAVFAWADAHPPADLAQEAAALKSAVAALMIPASLDPFALLSDDPVFSSRYADSCAGFLAQAATKGY
jgi:hypothetical protein